VCVDPGSHPPGKAGVIPARSLDRMFFSERPEKFLPESERKVQLDAADIGVIDNDGLAHLALALGALGLKEVTPTGLRPNDLARGGQLETLGHGFLGFAAGDGFWHGAWTITERRSYGNRKV